MSFSSIATKMPWRPAQRAGETSGNAPLGRDRMTTRRKHLVMQAVVKPTVILPKRHQPLVGQEPS